MKIAVLSDTHIPYAATELPKRVCEILETADAIIHAGDYQVDSVIETLESFADFYGVCGNMDPSSIQSRLPAKRIITLGGFNLGIIHGGGSPKGLEERVIAAFKNEPLAAIIYGHSHRAKHELKDGVFLFNPGSPTDTRFAALQSMGVLTIEEAINGEIIFF